MSDFFWYKKVLFSILIRLLVSQEWQVYENYQALKAKFFHISFANLRTLAEYYSQDQQNQTSKKSNIFCYKSWY